MASGIDFFKVKGDPYAIGFKLGRKTKRQTAQALQAHLERFPASKRKRLKPYYARLAEAGEKHLPEQMSELRGLAEGAGLSFQSVFDWNVEKFLGRNFFDNCTAFVLRLEDGLLLGHNDDCWKGLNGSYLARIETESGARILASCNYGFLPGLATAVNSFGFFTALNSLQSSHWGAGLPTFLLHRRILECESPGEAVKLLTQKNVSNAENFLLGKGMEFLDLELTGKAHHIFRPEGDFVHANHILSPELKPFESKTDMASTLSRQRVGQAFLDSLKEDEKSVQALKRVLSSHEGRPYTICRHAMRRGKEVDLGETLASSLIDSRKKEMLVSYGPPCKNKYKRFKL